MSSAIGIDLGTTNVCVAIFRDGKPSVVPNRRGEMTTPAAVAITEDGKRVVGSFALRQAIVNPEHTVYGAKRIMGHSWDSSELEKYRKQTTVEIAATEGGDPRIVLRGKQFSVAELASILLQEARVTAEDHLDDEVNKAVVTVPAYFNDNQRQAVRDACVIAGLEVLSILSEPTAAAIGYGYNSSEDKRVAVYDMGGGTFDISIVEVIGGQQFQVLGTAGDSFLGGEDFDMQIMAHLAKGFHALHGIDLRRSPTAFQRMKQAAQVAKCDLSRMPTATVNLPYIVSHGHPDAPLDLRAEVHRSDFEVVTSGLIEASLAICVNALSLAETDTSQIDEVLLVGGMTRMPAVQRAVGAFFKRRPSKGVHPDEVVAIGAALVAYSLGDEDIDDISLDDVTAHSLGVATAGDGFDIVIPANSRVPVSVPRLYSTSRDNQDRLRLSVLQGEHERASMNEPIQELVLSDLRRAPAGDVDIDVTFTLNEDGIFIVSAIDPATGEETRVESGSTIDEDELARMAADSQSYLEERREEEAVEKLEQQLMTLIAETRRSIDKLTESLPGDAEAAAVVEQVRKTTKLAEQLLMIPEEEILEEQVGRVAAAKADIAKLLARC